MEVVSVNDKREFPFSGSVFDEVHDVSFDADFKIKDTVYTICASAKSYLDLCYTVCYYSIDWAFYDNKGDIMPDVNIPVERIIIKDLFTQICG